MGWNVATPLPPPVIEPKPVDRRYVELIRDDAKATLDRMTDSFDRSEAARHVQFVEGILGL
jgi:hypothetical protein